MPNLFEHCRAGLYNARQIYLKSLKSLRTLKTLKTFNLPYRKYPQSVEKPEKIATFVLIILESSGM